MKKLFLIILCITLLVGCSSSGGTISYVKAKEKMINEGAILVDVRTQEEYDESHIEGAILLPIDDIDEKSVTEYVGDKTTTIIVYCKSGKRSAQAYQKLKNLGYKSVYDLGAMSNWKE